MSRRDASANLPDFLLRKRAREMEADTFVERMRESLLPCKGRVLIEQPSMAVSTEQRRTATGLWQPDQAWRSVREYGLKARVLKVHPDDAPHLEFSVGDVVLLPEHSGHPLYVTQELPYWIVGVNEILAIIHEPARELPRD